ncbi:hypothetical protein BU26DRAFT_556028 [Trematosphaeria pertusa]|uniref:Uncharacterized protein n=1 Tax=Trematosphaeria pertusa TaxID=390896 RepID=A0A6A6HTI8_9PLEO|nr:uncharacterized protein BU26DRAFT_556028 [Trematosphaeria pertusa]KAF2241504.1 hypothetical protein BU26DRAFT_556028 [Trematosphaeria pertusa]
MLPSSERRALSPVLSFEHRRAVRDSGRKALGRKASRRQEVEEVVNVQVSWQMFRISRRAWLWLAPASVVHDAVKGRLDRVHRAIVAGKFGNASVDASTCENHAWWGYGCLIIYIRDHMKRTPPFEIRDYAEALFARLSQNWNVQWKRASQRCYGMLRRLLRASECVDAMFPASLASTHNHE